MSGLDWIVFGCRSDYAADVAAVIERTRGRVVAFVDNLGDSSPHADGLVPLLSHEELPPVLLDLPTVIPLVTPGHRHQVRNQALAMGFRTFPALVDPTSPVAASACLDEGVTVNAAAVIAARAQLGAFVHVNRSCSVGHHAELSPFVTLGPGVVLAGRVVVESGAFVGAGATCAPGVRVGRNAVVGAGAVVVRDVLPESVVVGNPAKVIRPTVGYNDVFVP